MPAVLFDTSSLSEAPAFDAEVEGAGGDVDFDDVAGLFTQQGLGNGRLDGYLALAEVRLVGIDDGVAHAGVVGQIGYLNLAQQTDGACPQQGRVEHAGVLQHALLETDASQQSALLALGGMIFKILTQVTLCTGFGNGLTHLGQFHLLHVAQLGYQFVVALL